MANTTQKSFTKSAIACFLVLSQSIIAATPFQSRWAGNALQPQGFYRMGICTLRQIEPTLTGTGVKFVVVCQSFAYIDNEPQNGYLPAVEHNCFRTSWFHFGGHALLPAAISSFSVPVLAGTIGLLVQKAREDPPLSPPVSPEGGNCVIKAIVLNSATKLPYWNKGLLRMDDDRVAPLDFIQGAGMINAVGAYNQLIAGLNKPGEVPPTTFPQGYVWLEREHTGSMSERGGCGIRRQGRASPSSAVLTQIIARFQESWKDTYLCVLTYTSVALESILFCASGRRRMRVSSLIEDAAGNIEVPRCRKSWHLSDGRGSSAFHLCAQARPCSESSQRIF